MNLNFLNLGQQGSKRASVSDANPRAMLRRLFEARPDDTREELKARCLDAVENGSSGLWLAIFDYWFSNAYVSLTRKPSDTALADAMEQSGQQQLLEMIVPGSDKPLGDMTGTALRKIGGKYAEIGKRVGRARVRNVMTEDEIVEVFSK